MKALLTIMWVLVALATAAAGMSYVLDMTRATSAPQQAAVAAMCCAQVIVVYVIARALDAAIRPNLRPPKPTA